MSLHWPPDPGGAFFFLIACAALTSAVLVEDATEPIKEEIPVHFKSTQGVSLQVGELVKKIDDNSLSLSESLIQVNSASNQTVGSARRRRRRSSKSRRRSSFSSSSRRRSSKTRRRSSSSSSRRRRRSSSSQRRRRRSSSPRRRTPSPPPAPRPRPAPRPPPAPTGPRPSDSNLAAILDRHNKYRCMHGVQPLKWNEAIARNAASWARQTGGQMRHSSSQSRKGIGGFRYLGENLASGATGTRGVDMWYDEIKLTSGGRVNSFSSGTGHYTQVVWKGTSALGCAVYGRLLNCQYGEGGNMGGQFSNNVNGPVKSSSQCPDGASGGGSPSPSPPTSGGG